MSSPLERFMNDLCRSSGVSSLEVISDNSKVPKCDFQIIRTKHAVNVAARGISNIASALPEQEACRFGFAQGWEKQNNIDPNRDHKIAILDDIKSIERTTRLQNSLLLAGTKHTTPKSESSFFFPIEHKSSSEANSKASKANKPSASSTSSTTTSRRESDELSFYETLVYEAVSHAISDAACTDCTDCCPEKTIVLSPVKGPAQQSSPHRTSPSLAQKQPARLKKTAERVTTTAHAA